jgi:hypothetical protein
MVYQSRSLPYLSTLHPQFWHVHPPHHASRNEVALRAIGKGSAQRGQTAPNIPMPRLCDVLCVSAANWDPCWNLPNMQIWNGNREFCGGPDRRRSGPPHPDTFVSNFNTLSPFRVGSRFGAETHSSAIHKSDARLPHLIEHERTYRGYAPAAAFVPKADIAVSQQANPRRFIRPPRAGFEDRRAKHRSGSRKFKCCGGQMVLQLLRREETSY